jgi:hypothetical protein
MSAFKCLFKLTMQRRYSTPAHVSAQPFILAKGTIPVAKGFLENFPLMVYKRKRRCISYMERIEAKAGSACVTNSVGDAPINLPLPTPSHVALSRMEADGEKRKKHFHLMLILCSANKWCLVDLFTLLLLHSSPFCISKARYSQPFAFPPILSTRKQGLLLFSITIYSLGKQRKTISLLYCGATLIQW